MGNQRKVTPGGTDSDSIESALLGSRSLADYLAIPRDYAPETLAPPLEVDRLRAFVRGELAGGLLDEVCHLTTSFRSWDEALARVIREEAERGGDRERPDATS